MPHLYGRAMTRQPWRIDTVGDGSLAWVSLRPHEVAWSVPSAAVAAAGYTVTEERQSLVDDKARDHRVCQNHPPGNAEGPGANNAFERDHGSVGPTRPPH